MRRLFVLCLLVMLPFQGAWAVVAGIAALDAPCAAAQAAAGHGDRGHEMPASADLSGAMADCDGMSAGTCGDGSCAHCFGCHAPVPLALVAAPVDVPHNGKGMAVVARSVGGAPDHVPELPLRPPLLRRA